MLLCWRLHSVLRERLMSYVHHGLRQVMCVRTPLKQKRHHPLVPDMDTRNDNTALDFPSTAHLLIWPHPCFVLLDLARSHECVCFDACCDRETYQVAGFGPTFVFFYDFWSFSSGQGLPGINMSHPCVNMISLSTFTHEIIFRGFKAPTY